MNSFFQRMMQHPRHGIRIKIITAIAGAFLITYTTSNLFFLDDSPQLNAQFFQDIQSAPARFVALIRNPFSRTASNDEALTAEIPRTQHPAGIQLTEVVPGVRASEPDAAGMRYIKIDGGVTFEIQTITLDSGETVSVYVPVNQ